MPYGYFHYLRDMGRFNDFERYTDFSFWKDICEKYGTPRRYRRGEYFAHSGEILRYCGWINAGGFKHTLADAEGNLKTVGFVFDGSVLANYSSNFRDQPMPTDIIALRDSEVIVVPVHFIRERLSDDQELHLNFLQSLFDQAYKTILDTYRISSYGRYVQLTERFPHILELVPLSEIASYLNISLRQLHRFREMRLRRRENSSSQHNSDEGMGKM